MVNKIYQKPTETFMKLTEYGKLVRKARLDAEVTMLEMARSIGVAPSFLSATEVGSKKVSPSFLEKVVDFFASKGITIKGIHEAADVSNKTVSIDGLSTSQQFLVAGFARVDLSQEKLEKFAQLLAGAKKEGK